MLHRCPCCGTGFEKSKDILFQEDRGLVFIDNKRLQLSRTLYSLFQLLYQQMPATVSHERIMINLYQECEDPPFDTTIKTHIMKLRRKLSDTGFHIETEWGHGYRLERTHITAPTDIFPLMWT